MASSSTAQTQAFIEIDTIKDGVVRLKNGSLRRVILVDGINFDLKSEAEQEIIIYSYQNFLNSLEYPIQFLVRSRKLNIDSYLEQLEKRLAEEAGELMRTQMAEYIEFVRSFISGNAVMAKSFFVIVPYTPAILQGNQKKKFISLFSKKKEGEKQKNQKEAFEENLTQLEQRVSVVEQGLVRCGIKVAPLGTELIVELFYKIFNPGEAEKPIALN